MKTGKFHVDVRRCLRPKNLTEFSLDMSVTKSTLDAFGRRLNTISATPLKLSGI